MSSVLRLPLGNYYYKKDQVIKILKWHHDKGADLNPKLPMVKNLILRTQIKINGESYIKPKRYLII
jgi:hypothetical protein